MKTDVPDREQRKNAIINEINTAIWMKGVIYF